MSLVINDSDASAVTFNLTGMAGGDSTYVSSRSTSADSETCVVKTTPATFGVNASKGRRLLSFVKQRVDTTTGRIAGAKVNLTIEFTPDPLIVADDYQDLVAFARNTLASDASIANFIAGIPVG